MQILDTPPQRSCAVNTSSALRVTPPIDCLSSSSKSALRIVSSNTCPIHFCTACTKSGHDTNTLCNDSDLTILNLRNSPLHQSSPTKTTKHRHFSVSNSHPVPTLDPPQQPSASPPAP